MSEQFQQIENVGYIVKNFGKELWVQLCGRKIMNGAEGFFWSGLIPKDYCETALKTTDWEHDYGSVLPGFVQYGSDDVVYDRYSMFEFEPLVYARDFYGIKPNIIEISEEFRHLNNLYYDERENKYYSITEAGELDLVIKVEGEEVYCKLGYLKKYAAAKQVAVALYFDIQYKSNKSMEELGLKKTSFTKNFDDCCFDFYADNNTSLFGSEKKSYSVVHGKKLLVGGGVSESGYWPFEESKKFEDFIIGVNDNGDEVTFSSNHNLLANYFGANPEAPHYLTAIHFSKDVLTKYYANPDKYEVNDGYIRCQGLWLLQIDNHHDDYVTVYLGDLGRDLPHKEQVYWKSFNIVHDGGLSTEKFKRDFMAEFTDPKIEDLKFKQRFYKFKADWSAKQGWDFFLPFTKEDQYNFDHLRLPVSNSQVEFDGQVLSLVKTIIDSLNEKKLGKLIQNKEDLRGGISKLERYLSETGVVGYEVHIKFLRNLQDLRSTGSGHRKGNSYDKASSVFKLTEQGFVKTFKDILEQSYALIGYLDEHFLQ